MITAWNKLLEAYNEYLNSHPKRQEFDQLSTLEEKLDLDPDLFMDIYFLDRRLPLMSSPLPPSIGRR